MNIRLLLSLFFSLTFFLTHAQDFFFSENKGLEGLKVISSNSNTIKLSYHVHQFNLSAITIEEEQMMKLNHGLNLISGKAGAPDLPFFGANILIPDGAIAQLIVTSFDKEIYSDIEISPSAEIPFDTQTDIPAYKGSQYLENSFFPERKIQLEQTEIRGMNIASIGISPFQYNPVSKELIVYKNIEFEFVLSHSKGTYGEERFRSPFWDQILSDLVINTNDVPIIDYQKRNKDSKEEGCEYLIVVPNDPDFIAWADTIKQFRNEQGILTKVVRIDEIGGNSVNIIDDFFEDVYNNWNPVPSAVLLMADYGEDDKTIISKRYDHPYQGTYISDNHYADVTNNNLPDFVFARMTARNSDELKNMVYKFIDYERHPPVLPSFYNQPITALGWQTERWFQICSETIGGYMKNVLGKNPTRINAIYEGNPNTDPWSTANGTYSVTNYFGPNGLNYIPTNPSELGNWTGGNANDVVNAINAGSFILQHRDHGGYGGWGEPGFHSGNINQLNNKDLLSHIFSINCLTGQFDQGTECFAEKFHRKENGGALSITAASQVSYSFVNDVYVWGMYDNMWPDFLPSYGGNLIPERDFRPAFGSASAKYFLSTSNWAGDGMKTITYRLFHHHGDAFNIVYTEVPQDNMATYEVGINANTTTLDFEAEPFSLIGLSIEGEYLTSGICNEDGIISISIPQQVPQTEIKVVITKQNYFRHEGIILIIPAEGPYVVTTSYSINDENANNNGIIEYNEEISLDFTVKNVGVDLAENVELNLSCDDDYIQITDASETIGDILAGEEVSIEKAFTFNVSANIPDQHTIQFIFTATDGNNTWGKEINYTADAPSLQYSILNFEEIEGNNNGYFEPGETAIASFEMKNIGHCDYPSGSSTLYPNSSYISIDATDINFNTIAVGESLITSFETISTESTPYATTTSISQHMLASPFEVDREMYFNIGLIVEDWETADFENFYWQMNGDKDWEITDSYVSEGDYAVSISDLSHNQSSSIQLEYDVLGDHEISFFTQVSSQEDHDFLHFYIDDVIQDSWSGLIIFEQFSFPVSQGEHTFKWEYVKDDDGNSGLNTIWLDFIILPPGQTIIGVEKNNDKLSDEFIIYPNPNNGIFQINYSNFTDPQNLKIYNSLGQLVYQKLLDNRDINSESLDLSHLYKGLYIIQINTTENIVKTQKLIIE